MKHITLAVTGSIAAYKAADLTSQFTKNNLDVTVLMSSAATNFITPLTLQVLSKHIVHTDVMDEPAPNKVNHIEIAKQTDLFLVAPATANTLAKMSHGIADNLLVTTYLSMRAPVCVAPTMDLDMFAHPTTQENLQRLRMHGVQIIEPESGFLASGLEGKGRMAEPEQIVSAIVALFAQNGPLRGKKILVTSGPTREPLDPVRFISNHSSGRMGSAISDTLAELGAEVYCVAGPSEVYPAQLPNLHTYKVETAQQMYEQCTALWASMDVAIMSAAVADYRPEQVAENKIPHREQTLQLSLASCPDIAKALGTTKRADQLLVGFALETGNGLENAQRKLLQKNMDLCVLNTLADVGAGFCSNTNKTTFVYADGRTEARPLELKTELSKAIAHSVAQMLIKRS